MDFDAVLKLCLSRQLLVAARAVRQMTARAADSIGRACNLAAAGDLAELRLLSTDALRELDAHGSQG